MCDLFLKNLRDHQALFEKLPGLSSVIDQAINICSGCLKDGKKIMFCGNGGSASDSQHLAAEFIGRFVKDRSALPAIALTTDTSILTCLGNDYSFEDIFSRQVSGLGLKGDCIVGISTSGNSRNVIKAIMIAKQKGMHSIGLLGGNGGELSNICECNIIVPDITTARIQEAHILIGHTICGGVEKNLGFF